MSLNKVMLIGNVGKDPDIRYIDNTSPVTKVASFTIATTEKYKANSGELKENTEWHNIVAWRGLADIVEKYIKKGSQLYIEGKLRTRSWTDQTGSKRYTTEIVADSIQMLGRRSDNEASPYSNTSNYSNSSSYQQNNTTANNAYQATNGNQTNTFQENPTNSNIQSNIEQTMDNGDDLPF